MTRTKESCRMSSSNRFSSLQFMNNIWSEDSKRVQAKGGPITSEDLDRLSRTPITVRHVSLTGHHSSSASGNYTVVWWPSRGQRTPMQQFIGFSSLEEKQVSLRDANGAMVAAREMAAACSKMSGARTAGSQLDVLNEVIQIGDRLISSVNSAATSSARTHTLAFLLTGSGRLVREQLLCITRHHKQLNGLAGGSELQRLVGELGRTLEQWARFLSCPVPSESSTCVSTAATKFETQSSRVLSVVLRKRRDSGMAEGLEHCWNLWTASCSLLAAIKHNFSNDTTECARISDECRHHTAVRPLSPSLASPSERVCQCCFVLAMLQRKPHTHMHTHAHTHTLSLTLRPLSVVRLPCLPYRTFRPFSALVTQRRCADIRACLGNGIERSSLS